MCFEIEAVLSVDEHVLYIYIYATHVNNCMYFLYNISYYVRHLLRS